MSARRTTAAQLARMSDRELETLPTDALDRAAFGFTSGSLLTLHWSQIQIRYPGDLENVRHAVRTSKDARERLSGPPIDVSFRKGHFELEDGHHRWWAARMLNRTLHARVQQIDDNPIVAIRRRGAR